jgi:hypothetical protein
MAFSNYRSNNWAYTSGYRVPAASNSDSKGNKVISVKIGDMVHLTRDIGSVGIVLGINEVYQGSVRVNFISGKEAGKTYEVNNTDIVGVDDVIHEEEEVQEEASVVAAPVEEAVQKPASKKKWTKVEIVAMIKQNPTAVARGVICLNKNSNKIPEKSRPYVAYWAEYVAKGKNLTGRHLFNARRTCYFNAKVLVDAANGVL